MKSSSTIKITGFVLLLYTQIAFAQTNLNVCSHTAKINDLVFTYSIGEMTLQTTERSKNLIVTQGFLQPVEFNGTLLESALETNTAKVQPASHVKVYPNPTQNILFVEFMLYYDADISYQLFDIYGKVVISKSISPKKGLHKLKLDLQALAPGTYYLIIRKPGEVGNPENYSYKIQKTN